MTAKTAPQIIKSQNDAAMFSGWLVDNNFPAVNGEKTAPRMYGNDLFTWCWQNRRHCNDWIKAQQNKAG